MKNEILRPIVDQLREIHTPPVRPIPVPPKPAELDQDAGGGYNPDHTYPQT